MFKYVFMSVLVLSTSTLALAHEHGHEAGLIIGRTGSQPLTLSFEIPHSDPIVLNPASGFFNGWEMHDFCINALGTAEPDEDFYPLSSNSTIRLQIVSIDPGLMVINPNFFGDPVNYPPADASGESILLGSGTSLHIHPYWYAESANPAIGPNWQGTLNATFKLVDTGSTGYLESAPFTLSFTNVPEPMTATLLGLAGIAGMVRRRR